MDLALQDEAGALAYILLGKAGELWVKDSDVVPLGAVFDLRSVLLRVATLGGGQRKGYDLFSLAFWVTSYVPNENYLVHVLSCPILRPR